MEVKNLSTEERIIKASFNVLKSEGISKVTTKKIAKAANVSEVTIFRKFKTKKNLIEKVKEHYLNYILDKLDEIFEFDEDIQTEEYLTSSFDKVVALSDSELNVFKIAMEEVFYVRSDKKVIPIISTKIIENLTEFFQLQINKKRIRSVNPEVLALNMYGILFESILLWKIYGKNPKRNIDFYSEDFLDIIMNGISIKG